MKLDQLFKKLKLSKEEVELPTHPSCLLLSHLPSSSFYILTEEIRCSESLYDKVQCDLLPFSLFKQKIKLLNLKVVNTINNWCERGFVVHGEFQFITQTDEETEEKVWEIRWKVRKPNFSV